MSADRMRALEERIRVLERGITRVPLGPTGLNFALPDGTEDDDLLYWDETNGAWAVGQPGTTHTIFRLLKINTYTSSTTVTVNSLWRSIAVVAIGGGAGGYGTQTGAVRRTFYDVVTAGNVNLDLYKIWAGGGAGGRVTAFINLANAGSPSSISITIGAGGTGNGTAVTMAGGQTTVVVGSVTVTAGGGVRGTLDGRGGGGSVTSTVPVFYSISDGGDAGPTKFEVDVAPRKNGGTPVVYVGANDGAGGSGACDYPSPLIGGWDAEDGTGGRVELWASYV